MTTSHDAAIRTIEAVWRIEAAHLTAVLARMTRDVALAEDMAQEALAAALETWPETGVPPNPAAWLTTTAKNRLIDHHRRDKNWERKVSALANDPPAAAVETEAVERADDYLGDDMLRLLVSACHPALSLDARVALTLRCVAGLSTAEISRAFLVPESTAAQRIVRAKNTLRAERVGFELPTPEEASTRVGAVLEVIYLIFNEGYTASTGAEWTRPELCADALRLGRVLAARAPSEPEVHGLVALMELQASRLPARVGSGGRPVLLPDQDRRRWDRLLIRRGLASLTRAESLPDPLGPYAIQAGIAACHARAERNDDTDWSRIATLYELLERLWPSPVVALNRAVAVGYAVGPASGLSRVDTIAAAGTLADYPQLHAVRGDLLEHLGRCDEAAEAFVTAADLSRNDRETELFRSRAARARS